MLCEQVAEGGASKRAGAQSILGMASEHPSQQKTMLKNGSVGAGGPQKTKHEKKKESENNYIQSNLA